MFKVLFLITASLSLAFGQESGLPETVPMESVFDSIAELVKNYKGLKGIGLAAAIISIVFQLLKTALFGGLMDKAGPFLRRAVLTGMGLITAIVMAVAGGMSWIEALIAGLLSSGGAVALYEALKPFFKKKESLPEAKAE